LLDSLLQENNNSQHCHIDSLPPEILHHVLKLLSPRDLKAAMLVNKRWVEVGEDPSLWTWARVAIGTEEDIQKKLNIRRLQLLREILLPNGWGMGDSTMTKLLRTFDEIPSLRIIDGLEKCSGITHADPSVVARVLNRLEVLDLGKWIEFEYPYSISLSPEQLKLLFTTMSEKTNIKYLCVHVPPADMCKISPELFGAALSNVEEVEIRDFWTETSLQQQEALLGAIMRESSLLRCLWGDVWFEPSIDPEFMGRAMKFMEFMEASFSGEQLAVILRNLVGGESRLKALYLGQVEQEIIDGLDQELVRRAKDNVKIFGVD